MNEVFIKALFERIKKNELTLEDLPPVLGAEVEKLLSEESGSAGEVESE